jgi:signal transduction histidine kinase
LRLWNADQKPYKQTLFATLLAMILVPTIAGACCSLAIGWLWSGERSSIRKNQQLADTAQTEGEAFCHLVSYSYAVLSSGFEQQGWKREAALKLKANAGRELSRLLHEKSSSESADSQVEELSSSILRLKSRVDSLQSQSGTAQFNDNLSRFSSIAGVIKEGRALSLNLEKLLDSIEKQQHSQSLSDNAQRALVMTVVTVIAALSSLASMVLFVSYAKRVEKNLGAVKMNFLRLKRLEHPVEPEQAKDIDEIAYVNKVFSEIAHRVVEAFAEYKLLIQMIVHDLRSPLMSMQISVSMFVDAAGDELALSQIQACDRIEGLTETLSNQITNLLLFDSLKSEKLELACSEFNLFDLTKEALAKSRKKAAGKDLRFENICSTRILIADRVLILRVMQIWLQWSIARAPRGSKILIKSSENNNDHTWSVSNLGPEIPLEQRRDFFAGFDAKDKTNDHGSLYFAMTKLIINAHRGTSQLISGNSGTVLQFSIASTNRSQTRVPFDRRILPTDLFPTKKSSILSLGLVRRGLLFAATPALFQICALLLLSYQLNQFLILDRAVNGHRAAVAYINTVWIKAYQANSYVSSYLATASSNQKNKAVDAVNALRLTVNKPLAASSSQEGDKILQETLNNFVEEELHHLEPFLKEATELPPGDSLSLIPRMLSLAEPLHEEIMSRLELEAQNLNKAQDRLSRAWQVVQVTFVAVSLVNILGLICLAVYSRAKTLKSLNVLVANAGELGRGRALKSLPGDSEELGELNELLITTASVLERAIDENNWIGSVLADEIWSSLQQTICDLIILNDFVKSDPKFRPSDKEQLQRAVATALKLADLVQDLFALVDSTGDRQMIKPTRANLLDFVRETVDTIAYLGLAKNLSIRFMAPSTSVLIDSGRLGQVLTNILCNAIKFSPPNAEISVSALLQSEKILFEIADQGPGIPKETQLHVFDRYFKSEQGSASAFGLGLSICKVLVDAHNGQIGLHTNQHGGTTFVIEIPYKAPDIVVA